MKIEHYILLCFVILIYKTNNGKLKEKDIQTERKKREKFSHALLTRSKIITIN